MIISMKCPNCSGPLIYDPESDKMKCDYCNGRKEVEEYVRDNYGSDKSSVKLNWDISQHINDIETSEEEYVELNLYHCTSCGAQLMLSGTEASTFCSFCDSPTIVFDRVSKELRPQRIIPFRITEEQALERIKSSFSGRKYIPEKIKKLTVDKVRGIYIPFWLYDCYIRRGMHIKASTDDKTYHYYRDASCTYRHLTLDASLNLSNEYSQRLEPYNMEELQKFELPYLSGYYADKFDVPCDVVESMAHTRCQQYLDKAIIASCPKAVDEIISEVHYCNTKIDEIQEDYQVERVEYALLPAYFVNLHYEDGKQLVIVNGQTGKVVGDLPIEKEQIPKIFAKYTIIHSIIFSIISVFCMMFPKAISVLLIIITYLALVLLAGIRSYRRYQMNRYRLMASNMKSYVNDREGGS